MKYVKMLGLAAVAALALMAFVGVGSASATTLCKTNSTPCPAEWKVKKGDKLTASLDPKTTALLQAGFANVTCTESHVEGTVENEGSETETVSGPVTSVTFGSCNCEEVKVNVGGSLELHYTEKMNGTLTSKGATATVKCAGVTCKYKTAASGTHMGTLTGSDATGGAATLDIATHLEKHEGSFLCANSAEWTASYVVTTPNPLYVDAS